MGVGVFGKLPARRDYVQHGVDARLMAALDPWLQSSVAESRRALGQAWLDAWLTAPIWRFWLGRRVAGIATLGAMMPSVDGVGRYFPLCVLGAYDGVPPPEEDEQAAWFEATEALMLEALAEGGTYEDLLVGLDSLPQPALARPRESVAARMHTDVAGAFAALRGGMMDQLYDGFSCWWVPSPDEAGPVRALVRRGLPDPAEYAALIRSEPQPELAPAIGGA